ncbi:VTT domain-containing protein [Psychrobacillus sp. FJAT-51614]|uniref:VTT domain-containing protein n=1 Tax=Psychrobacillus mangrovi TaxID=3117745 RepID=A0ABU8F6I4_9BACI
MEESTQLIPILSTPLKFLLLLLLNLGIGAIGFVPSLFVTAINIDALGLIWGSILTFTGEILGALFGFHLYRWGFSKVRQDWFNHSIFNVIKNSSPMKVFTLIILFRIIPFVPSGLVTAGASLTSISGWFFMVASTLGKIPAVVIEIAIVFGIVKNVPTTYLYGFMVLFLIIITPFWMRKKRRS